MTKISIIIPVFNSNGKIERCLQSVIGQTMDDIEIICVDDCSKDDSTEIINQFAKNDSRIILIYHEKNLGLLKTRGDGVKKSSGEYILFVDQDDTLVVDACEKLYSYITTKNADLLYFGTKIIGGNNIDDNFFNQYDTYLNPPLNDSKDAFDDLFVRKIPISWNVWNKMYDANLIKRSYDAAGDKYLIFSDDLYITFFVFYFSNKFERTLDKFYEYHLGEGFTGNTDVLKELKTCCDNSYFIYDCIDFLKSKNENELIQKCCYSGPLLELYHSFDLLEKITDSRKKSLGIEYLKNTWDNEHYHDLYVNEMIRLGYTKELSNVKPHAKDILVLKIKETKRLIDYKLPSSKYYTNRLAKITLKLYYLIMKKLRPNLSTTSNSAEGLDINTEKIIEYNRFKLAYLKEKEQYCFEPNYCVDIIIPIYNGYEYLKKLFSTIEYTKIKHRLIVINDFSSDERVGLFLNGLKNDNIIIVNNTANLGFVKSVNKGLTVAEHDVVLLNSDVELPHDWLERLMAPIVKNRGGIASSTPFSNAGGICSFPDILVNNKMPLGCNVDEIDDCFKVVSPLYSKIPCGVGYVMGMNIDVIKIIGFFDDATFGRGYGEEVDWCKRAEKSGFTSVIVEDLFVFHKETSSFNSEEKMKLIAEHDLILNNKYSNFLEDAKKYIDTDPNYPIKQYALMNVSIRESSFLKVYFSHDWGGGAEIYLQKILDKDNSDNISTMTIVYKRTGAIETVFRYANYRSVWSFNNYDDLFDFLNRINVKEMIINELVSFEKLYKLLGKIIEYKHTKGIILQLNLHDYYCICPALELLNNDDKYCNPNNSLERCNKCKKDKYSRIKDVDMSLWRNKWKELLSECDKIVCYSKCSETILFNVYGNNLKTNIVPHKVEYIQSIKKQYNHRHTINIGIPGAVSVCKGLNVIRDMQKEITNNNLDIKLTIIGISSFNIQGVEITGRYEPPELGKLIMNNEIDVLFIPSIWPETFSFTTEEAIKTELPVVVFDIGAQAERVHKYKNGLVIKTFNPKEILKEITIWYTLNYVKQS